jgi:hypothetical protein
LDRCGLGFHGFPRSACIGIHILLGHTLGLHAALVLGFLPRLLHDMIATVAAIYSGGWECPGQLQVSHVLHLFATNCAIEGRGLRLMVLKHGTT